MLLFCLFVCCSLSMHSRLLHHSYTRRVQSLGVRPNCRRAKDMKKLTSLPKFRKLQQQQKKSPHWSVQLLSSIYLRKPNICEPICELSPQQQNATRGVGGVGGYKKKSKQNVPQSVTGAETNPIICVSCCKFVLMVGVRK